jgi:selenocysteine lyase/cysteine desulfurase
MNKRNFIKSAITIPFLPTTFSGLMKEVENVPNNQLAENEDFWLKIRADYKLKPDYINLENGYYCMQPQTILEAYIKQVKELNYQASFYLRTRQFDDKAAIRNRLANLIGCTKEELIITRNTTESLDTVIAGIDWKAGDEIIMAEQDYGAMQDMFRQQAKRYGIVCQVVSIPNNPKNDEEIVAIYEKMITPKTRLLMLPHMVNITGQIMPVRKICNMAHLKNVEVMVDGAHAVAHIPVNIADLDCDYYGSSLHKWLCCPLGAGILFVKKDKVEKLWAVFADSNFEKTDIRKLNHTGTHPCSTDLAILSAIDYYENLGAERKETRLRYLQNYWTNKVRKTSNIVLNTPEDPTRSCAIANVGIATMQPTDLAKTLLDKYKIYTVAIDSPTVKGVRITPNTYTTLAELDQLVLALKELAS